MSLMLRFQDVVHLCITPISQRLNLQQIDVTSPLTYLILESQEEGAVTSCSSELRSTRQLTEHRFGRAATPRWNLEFIVSFKGTLELFCVQPPLIAECVALSQTLLQKHYSGGLAATAVSQSLFVIQCLVQGRFKGNRQPVEAHKGQSVHTLCVQAHSLCDVCSVKH